MKILILVILLILVISLGIYGYCSDRKQWNNGKCPKCNVDWVNFDEDSQGGDGYECPKCGNKIRISWF